MIGNSKKRRKRSVMSVVKMRKEKDKREQRKQYQAPHQRSPLLSAPSHYHKITVPNPRKPDEGGI